MKVSGLLIRIAQMVLLKLLGWAGVPDGSTKTSHNDPKSTLNHSKSSETDVLTSKTHSNMPKSTSNGDLDLKTGVLAPKSLSLDAKTSPKSSPDIENSLKLLLSCDSIIRASTKLNKAAPHIYERCTAADGVSISNALKIEYKHKDHPNTVFMYKRSDIKYDIQRGWIYLVAPIAEASGGIDVDLEPEVEETISNNVGENTPLSGAPTPLQRGGQSTSNSRPSRVASQNATNRIRSSFSSYDSSWSIFCSASFSFLSVLVI